MEKRYHLLNGDALKECFPPALNGEKLIFRECLVDGPVSHQEEAIFYTERIKFLCAHYGAEGKDEYSRLFLSQMKKLDEIPKTTALFLWFEADLFCQVNLWYCLHRLFKNNKKQSLYLVMPPDFTPFSFAGLDAQRLKTCFQNAKPIKSIEAWAELWEAYQRNDTEDLLSKAKLLQNEFPFVYTAVQAHLDRIPTKNNIGRPLERLKTILKELNSPKFGDIFQEFCKTEAHYGFGDLTVKRLLKELQEKE